MRYKILMIFLITISSSLFASDIDTVHWGTEVWKGFTDGSGLYTRVMRRIYEAEGLKLEIHIYPFERALQLTKAGALDITGGVEKKLDSNDSIQSSFPIFVTNFNAFFHRETIKDYNGIESIRGRKIVCTPTVGKMIGLREDEFQVVQSREQALKLVLAKRFDIYIDEENVLLTTLDTYAEAFDMRDYRFEVIDAEALYMISPNTERGRRVMDIFNNGIRALSESGELGILYNSLGFSAPVIDN